MRRRRNEPHTRRRQTHLGDPGIHLRTRQLSALTRFCALRHLDLNFTRLNQIFTRHTKAARCDLLDRAILRVAVRFRRVTRRILAAFSGVALPADTVHGHGQRFMRLFADGTVRHGTRLKTFDDLGRGFHFFKRNGFERRFKIKQTSQRTIILCLMVNGL